VSSKAIAKRVLFTPAKLPAPLYNAHQDSGLSRP
jgi:hypothetical protein